MVASAPSDPVDVLIVGAGASGAAVAWSLAETRMHILCLEQGDWMRPDEYPSTRRDWEQLAVREYSPNPNIRARPEDYPINDADSPIAIVNFNGVGGSTVFYAAHFPRLHPSDFRTRTLDGVGEDWPVDYPTLEPFFALNDRMMGVSGLAGDPAYPRHELPLLVVMYNNRAYYSDWEHQIRVARQRGTPEELAYFGMELDNPAPDFAALARSFGWWAEGPIDQPGEMRAALQRARAVVKEGRPALVDVITQMR